MAWLAVAQAEGASGRELLVAAIAGYEVGIRVGEFLGRSHYKTFHTTGTAGTLASAAAVAKLFGLDADGTQHAFGSAGTQSAGLWEFLRDAADSNRPRPIDAVAPGISRWRTDLHGEASRMAPVARVPRPRGQHIRAYGVLRHLCFTCDRHARPGRRNGHSASPASSSPHTTARFTTCAR